eukprot:4022937-Prymnesium_polylepis.1
MRRGVRLASAVSQFPRFPVSSGTQCWLVLQFATNFRRRRFDHSVYIPVHTFGELRRTRADSSFQIP